MSLHQYRLIRQCPHLDGILEHVPRLVPFMVDQGPQKNVWRQTVPCQYDAMFGHELGHIMEIFERGAAERLKQENLGWPMNNFATFTAKAATAECKVFAMQWLLEELFTGKIDHTDILNPENVATVLGCPKFWTRKEQFHEWASSRSVADRLQDAMDEYRPKVKTLLDATVNYMVDECAEFL